MLLWCGASSFGWSQHNQEWLTPWSHGKEKRKFSDGGRIAIFFQTYFLEKATAHGGKRTGVVIKYPHYKKNAQHPNNLLYQIL
tara:strand:+ start:598 stop:846 length:249 start_codon:yes stop_codon:yes gene_type:complete